MSMSRLDRQGLLVSDDSYMYAVDPKFVIRRFDMAIDSDVGASLGTIMLGCTAGAALSGIIGLLTFLFFRLYPYDPPKIKLLVVWLWLLDAIHICMLCSSNWQDLIVHYGDRRMLDYIPPTTALAILFTCLSSFTVHCYYTNMLYKLSEQRWYLAAPLILLAITRLGLGINSTIRCLVVKSWTTFIDRFEWSITAGYCISSIIDILVSASLCWFLCKQKRRTDVPAASHLLDTVTMYIVNSGTLTCLFTLMSLISWFAFRGTLIFLGTHFLVGKLYTIAVLTTLVMRRFLHARYKRDLARTPRTGEFSIPPTPDSESMFADMPHLAEHDGVAFEAFRIKEDRWHGSDDDGALLDPEGMIATNRAVTDTLDIESRSLL